MFHIQQFPHVRATNLTPASRLDIDVRARLLVAFATIVAIALITRVDVALMVAVFILVFAWCFAPSRSSFARGLAFPAITGLILLLLQAYTYGTTPVSVFLFPVFLEGVISGVLIVSRILASVSILLMLVQVTSPLQLAQSLAWFRVPSEIREMMLLMLRYITVLTSETTGMFRAQKARLGYSSQLGFLSKLKNLSIIAGMTLIRAHDKSHRIFLSMKARGYTNAYSAGGQLDRFKTTDYTFMLFSFVLVICIMAVGVA